MPAGRVRDGEVPLSAGRVRDGEVPLPAGRVRDGEGSLPPCRPPLRVARATPDCGMALGGENEDLCCAAMETGPQAEMGAEVEAEAGAEAGAEVKEAEEAEATQEAKAEAEEETEHWRWLTEASHAQDLRRLAFVLAVATLSVGFGLEMRLNSLLMKMT